MPPPRPPPPPPPGSGAPANPSPSEYGCFPLLQGNSITQFHRQGIIVFIKHYEMSESAWHNCLMPCPYPYSLLFCSASTNHTVSCGLLAERYLVFNVSFPDCRGSPEYVEESKNLLQKLKDVDLPSKLPESCIRTYTVPWTKNGWTWFIRESYLLTLTTYYLLTVVQGPTFVTASSRVGYPG